MKIALNVYQALFIALLFGKLGGIGQLTNLNWVWVFAPLIAGTLIGLADKILRAAGVYDQAKIMTGNIYLNAVRKRATEKEIKRQKEQMRKAANLPINRAIKTINRELN